MVKISKRDLWGISFLCAILIGNAFFLNYNAFRFFNFLDMGSFLDASWRVFRGQQPYIDFIYCEGPVYLYMNALFFHLFGFGKTAILAHLVVVHSVVIVLVYTMLRSRVPIAIALLGSLLTAPSFYWGVSHPWHDQSAHFWGILGVAVLVWKIPFRDKKNAFLVGALCCVLAAISFLAKPGPGAAYGIVFFAVLLTSSFRKEAMKGFFLGLAGGLFLALFLIRHPKEFLEQTYFVTKEIGSMRFDVLRDISNWFVGYYWIPLTLVLSVGFRHVKEYKELWALFIGITFVGIFSAITGGIVQEYNNFLWGIQMALAFIVMWKIKESQPAGGKQVLFRSVFGALIVGAISLTILSAYYGIKLKIWTYYVKNPVGTYALQTKPFRGWLFLPPEGAPLDNMVYIVNKRVAPDETLLNLTDLYLIYALTGRDSYRKIPFVYMTDLTPAPGKQRQQVREHIISHPPDWAITHRIFSKEELGYLGLEDFVRDRYRLVATAGFYQLLKKK